jgi:hypothetical protein
MQAVGIAAVLIGVVLVAPAGREGPPVPRHRVTAATPHSVSPAGRPKRSRTWPNQARLHGRGSQEKEILALADHLPVGPTYAAVRAPIAENGGYAWFANRGIGR